MSPAGNATEPSVHRKAGVVHRPVRSRACHHGAMTPLVLGHRGARRVAPENTLAAFAAARAQGADGIELDVRATRDGQLVVHHDPALSEGPVLAEADLADLRAVRPDLPTLAEALDGGRGLLVNVEIKNLPWEAGFDPDERVADAVVDLLEARGGTDRIIVSSFNLPTVDRVRARSATLPTGMLLLGGTELRAMATVAHDHGHDALHPEVRSLDGAVAADQVAAVRATGLQVNVWTVNDPADVVRLAGLGVDALVTDVPDVTRAALGR